MAHYGPAVEMSPFRHMWPSALGWVLCTLAGCPLNVLNFSIPDYLPILLVDTFFSRSLDGWTIAPPLYYLKFQSQSKLKLVGAFVEEWALVVKDEQLLL